MKQTVVGAFDQYSTAQRAADLLASRGVARDHIHVEAAGDGTDSGYRATAGGTSPAHGDEGVMGSVRSFFSEVFGSDREHEDLHHYAETIKRGGAVVAVDVDETDRLEVAEVCRELKSAGAIDLDQQISQWRSQDRSGHALPAADMRGDVAERGREEVIPVVREDIDIGKRVVEQGGIRVYTHVVEQPVHESVDLRSERAVVERRPVNRPLTDADAAFQDRTIEVRESAEKAVVSKTARVVEEVRVGKEVQHQTQEIQDTVRHTEVDVQRVEGGASTGTSSGTLTGSLEHRDLGNDVHALEYREHWTQNFANTGGRYEDYDPAYRYGHSLAGDERYRGRDWSAIEPEARRDWEARNSGGTWEGMKSSVRHAWERAKR